MFCAPIPLFALKPTRYIACNKQRCEWSSNYTSNNARPSTGNALKDAHSKWIVFVSPSLGSPINTTHQSSTPRGDDEVGSGRFLWVGGDDLCATCDENSCGLVDGTRSTQFRHYSPPYTGCACVQSPRSNVRRCVCLPYVYLPLSLPLQPVRKRYLPLPC